MSVILDALRKSDRQRTRQAAERLRDGPGAARPAVLPHWILGALLASVLLLAVALFLALQQAEPGTSSRSATGANSEIMENEPAVAVKVRPLGGELATTSEAQVAATRTPPAAAVEPDVAMNTINVADLDAPPFDALPAATRAQLPDLHVDIHAWSEDPQARFVLINLRRYQEGERLQEGPLVRRILPDGVVLDADGIIFSLPRQ